MAKVILLSCIKKGSKNTRYLIKYNGEFASVKLSTDQFYELGSEIEVEDNKINEKKEYNPNWEKTLSVWTNNKRNVLKHLSNYKRNILGITEDGFWEDKDGNKYYYSHILPEGTEDENIIKSAYTESIKKTKEKYKSEIHRGFKNLNSSQAFAFNFFQPIIDNNLFSELISTVKNVIDLEYEKKNHDETQFDFYIKDDNQEYSFEVKYTEDDFGSAPMDSSHEAKWKTIYKDKMKNILKTEMTCEEFLDEYQLWRNILFATEGMEVRFVFPKFREDLTEKVNNAKKQCNEDIKKKIDIIYVDTFVSKMKESNDENLRKHYSEFERKYLPF